MLNRKSIHTPDIPSNKKRKFFESTPYRSPSVNVKRKKPNQEIVGDISFEALLENMISYSNAVIKSGTTCLESNQYHQEYFSHVRNKVHTVRNKSSDNADSMSCAFNAKLAYLVKNNILQFSDNEIFQYVDNYVRLANFESTISGIVKSRIGNCSEYSLLGLNYLLENNINIEAEKFIINGGDHTFLVFNRMKDSKEHDPSSWGENSYICDLWAKKGFKASEYMKDLKNYYREDGAAKLEDFNSDKHTLTLCSNHMNLNELKKYRSEKLKIKNAYFVTKLTEISKKLDDERVELKNLAKGYLSDSRECVLINTFLNILNLHNYIEKLQKLNDDYFYYDEELYLYLKDEIQTQLCEYLNKYHDQSNISKNFILELQTIINFTDSMFNKLILSCEIFDASSAIDFYQFIDFLHHRVNDENRLEFVLAHIANVVVKRKRDFFDILLYINENDKIKFFIECNKIIIAHTNHWQDFLWGIFCKLLKENEFSSFIALLDLYGDYDEISFDGYTLLGYAIVHGYVEIAEALLKRKVDPTEPVNDNGMQPLFFLREFKNQHTPEIYNKLHTLLINASLPSRSKMNRFSTGLFDPTSSPSLSPKIENNEVYTFRITK